MAAPVLDIAIVGAGIAGLTAALCLRQTGHHVTVYERKPDVQTIGGPLAVMPNGVRALKHFGIAEPLGGEVKEYAQPWRWRRWDDGSHLSEMSGSTFADQFGEPKWSFARAELQMKLWQEVKRRGIPVCFSSKIATVIESEAAIVFEDGTKIQADLIVGADGVRSIVRDSFLTADQVHVDSTGTAYMVSFPRSEVEKHPDPDVSRYMQEVTFWMGPQRSITCSHLRNDEDVYHMTLKVPYTLSADGVWDRNGKTSDAKKYFQDFHPSISKLLSLVKDEDCYLWRISQVNPLKTWISSSGRVLIIGDAAHAMVPNAAQGATMGIEDAAALAVCLSSKGIASSADIPRVLRTFEALRKPRCEFVVARASHREKLYHLEDGPEQEARDQRMKSWGKMYGVDKNIWDGKHIDEPTELVSPLADMYLMGYDVVDHVTRTLEQQRSTGLKESRL